MILFLGIMISCKTTQTNNITLPPTPKRQEMNEPENSVQYVDALIYYEGLVEKWEAWGDSVLQLVGSSE